ncbi:chorismate-binding protein [Algoriphagus boritolerans]|uniref:Isochorismate synthase n=1 Tax=Algoriphagus boritolerans DSM 17298 = JCM 18970 TaxID=1120964 RepID=A0A1H5WW89_9BACT|nr:chorismate-binding protein [Algoriphagus boritolerans]SEG03450.1 isochorismate synthase [Algoriphagus boritolerans DSM 17298 = JCM 18970]
MNVTGSLILTTKSEILDLLFLKGFSSGGSFALWRKPKTSHLEFLMDHEQNPSKVDLAFEELPAGFIVHPFADQADKKAFFIKANQYFSFHLDQDLDKEELPEWLTNTNEDAIDSIKSSIKKLLIQKSPAPVWENGSAGEKNHFTKLVQLGIEAIAAGIVEKVVPARTKSIEVPENFDLGTTFLNMIEAYPNSFVNFFHIPTIGTWIGASPETLIKTKEEQFHTMALAGTQPASGENPLKSAAWTQKEIEEQALVCRYIVDCFKKIRLREYEEHGPKTIMAGNLLHLRTDFKVDMKATGFPQLGSVMLDLLHPTSAVCGMPRKEAHDFLQAHEGFDRSFFAGFLGPVNIEAETTIFVNLRTASFVGNKAILYAGAGVTEDSDPDKEWEETELKCQIIGKFIQNPSA